MDLVSSGNHSKIQSKIQAVKEKSEDERARRQQQQTADEEKRKQEEQQAQIEAQQQQAAASGPMGQGGIYGAPMGGQTQGGGAPQQPGM